MKHETLLLDLDGTLFDSELWNYESWKLVRACWGLETPIDLWRNFVARRVEWDPYDDLLNAGASRQTVSEARRGFMGEMFSRARPTQGTLEIFAWAAERDLKVGVVTNRQYESARTILGGAGLDGVPIFSAGIFRKKPRPDVYCEALRWFGSCKTSTLAVEDSPDGAAAALGAGIDVAVLSNWLWVDSQFPEGCEHLGSLWEVMDFL